MPDRRALPLLLLLLTATSPTSSLSNFYDLNDLRAFSAAASPDDTTLYTFALRSTQENFTHSDTSPNPTVSASSTFRDPTSALRQEGQLESERNHIQELKERDGACGALNSCERLGAPSLCCPTSAVCSADSRGTVGCCPVGAACTGLVPGRGRPPPTTSPTTSTTTTTSRSGGGGTTTTTTTSGQFTIPGSTSVIIVGPSDAANGVLRPPSIFRAAAVMMFQAPRILVTFLRGVRIT